MNLAMDEALERLRGRGPEMTTGMQSHGPMAAQALVALGRGDAAQWADRYRRHLGLMPAVTSPLNIETWRSGGLPPPRFFATSPSSRAPSAHHCQGVRGMRLACGHLR